MGVEQIRANLGAFRDDLSLFGDSSPSDQNEHSVSWQPSVQNGHSVRSQSKLHFVALIGSRPQNEALIFGTYDRQGSNPQNEALKRGFLLKSSPHNEDLIRIKGKDQTLKMRF